MMNKTRDLSYTRGMIKKNGDSPDNGLDNSNANYFTKQSLRQFDKLTGGFRGKEITEEFSINKAQMFLQ